MRIAITASQAFFICVFLIQPSQGETPDWYRIPIEPNWRGVVELSHIKLLGLEEQDVLKQCAKEIKDAEGDADKQSLLYQARGDVYYYYGRFPESLSDYQQAAELTTADIRLRCSIVRATAANENSDSAIKQCLAILQETPDSFAALELLAMNQALTHHHDLAVEYATRAISVDASIATPYLWRGVSLAKTEKPTAAIRDLDQFILLCPAGLRRNENLAYYTKGSLLAKRGQLDEAIALYELAGKLKPASYKALWNLHIIYSKKGQHVLSRLTAERMAKLEPTNLDTSIALAHARLENGDVALALAPAQDWAKRDPNSHYPILILAQTFHRLGKYETAKKNFDAATDLASNDYDVKIAYALFLCTCPPTRGGDLSRGIALVREARSFFSGEPDEYWHYAYAIATAIAEDKNLAQTMIRKRLEIATLSRKDRRRYQDLARQLKSGGSLAPHLAASKQLYDSPSRSAGGSVK